MQRRTWMILGLGTVLALAGCAAPEETGPGDDTTGDGDPTQAEPEYVRIDGLLYECDDTLDFDGVCDEYELADSELGDVEARQEATSEGGSVTLDGQTYTCEDTRNVAVGDEASTVGECDRYVLESEA